MSRPEKRLLVAVDFDGVLHSNTSYDYPPDPLKVPDPPVPGMIAWLIGLVRHPSLKVTIFSARCGYSGGVEVMTQWLQDNGTPKDITEQLNWLPEEPPSIAHVLIDDRAVQFMGRPIPIEEILEFRPWNRS